MAAYDIEGVPRSDTGADASRLAHLESLMSSIGGVIWEYDWSAHTFTFVSDGAERLLGFTTREWLEPGFWHRQLHPADAERIIARTAAAVRGGQAGDDEYRLLHKNGATIWVRAILTADQQERDQGSLRGLLVDITPRKLAEQSLSRHELRFGRLAEQVGNLAMQMDHRGVIIRANGPARQLLADGESVEGRSIFDFLARVPGGSDIDSFAAHLHSGRDVETFRFHLAAPDKPGRLYHLHAAAEPWPAPQHNRTSVIGEDVTERSRFESEINRKAEEFDAIFELSHDLFFRVGPDGTILGYTGPSPDGLYPSPEYFLGKHFADVFPDTAATCLTRGVESCHVLGKMVVSEYALSAPGHDRAIDYEARYLPLADDNTAVVVRDVSRAKEAQRGTAESRDFLAGLLELLDVGVLVVTGPTCEIKRYNRRAEVLFGYGADDLLGVDIDVLFGSEARADDGRHASLCSLTTDIDGLELHLPRRDGTFFDAELSITLVGGAEGDRILVVRDISERMAAERRLRQSEERFRATVEQSPLGMHMYHLEGDDLVFRGANPAADAILGIDHRAALGRPLHELSPGLAASAAGQRFACIAQDGGSWQAEDAEYAEGSIDGIFEVTVFQIQANQIAVVFRDVTERRVASAREQEYAERLRALTVDLTDVEDAERRRIAEELHDRVSQTLAVALMRLKAARRGDGSYEPEEVVSGADLLKSAIAETRTITAELFPPVLNELGLVSAIRWLAEDAERTYGLPCVVEGDADASRLGETGRRVMFRGTRELLTNAAKHSRATRVTVLLRESESGLEVTVDDDGRGFDASGGAAATSGFGLFSIRERLSHLNGRLDIASAPQEGTRATIFLPWGA